MQPSETTKVSAVAARGSGIPASSSSDLSSLGFILAATAVTWLTAERRWEDIARRVVDSRLRVDRSGADAQARYLAAVIGETPLSIPVDTILRKYLANRSLSKMQSLRCHHPAGWHPPLRLEGRAHVDAALAEGRGTILWVAPFVFGPLLSKMAFHTVGLKVSHLSRYSHGYSKTRLGARYLNPIRTRIEERYLAERIVIGPDGSPREAMRALTARLQANRVVSVSIGAQGRQRAAAPFMNGQVAVATGTPRLAARMGATILPVFTYREPDGVYVTRIEAPLLSSSGTDEEQAADEIVRQLVSLLEAHACRWPDQFWWHYDIMRPLMPRGGRASDSAAAT